MKVSMICAAAFLLVLSGASFAKDEPATPEAASQAPEIAHQDWTFSPPFGTYDNAQLQRGFQVYKEICSNCHSMRLLAYRNLGEPGGPEFSPKTVEVLASQVQVTDGPNEKGEMFQRPARPSDHFRSPFANEQLARLAFLEREQLRLAGGRGALGQVAQALDALVVGAVHVLQLEAVLQLGVAALLGLSTWWFSLM